MFDASDRVARYGRSSYPRSRHRGFRRDWLPDPETYYRKHLALLGVSGQWATARCPFHDDTHPSLSVSLTHGGFYCHNPACGASGGDVLDFHRRRYGLSFAEAARDLGAWAER